MACKCCDRYAPPHHDDSPLGACSGSEAIAEARRWAMKFKARAEEAEGMLDLIANAVDLKESELGQWVDEIASTQCGCGQRLPVGVFPECDKCVNGESPRKEHGDSAPVELSTIENSDKPKKLSTHGDPCCKPGECKQGHLDTFHCLDWRQNKDLVFCAGKDRHHFLRDSPMHEQMWERGCFKCGAFPEAEAPTCAHDGCNNKLLKMRNLAPYCSMLCKVNSR